jgi:hypothetical protein
LRGRLQGHLKGQGQFCDVYGHKSIFVINKFEFYKCLKGFAKSERHVDLHGQVILQGLMTDYSTHEGQALDGGLQ